MENQGLRKPLSTGTNGKPQPLPAVYTPLFQDKDTDTEELDLGQILTVVRRRAVAIASVAVVVSAAIGFWTIHSQPKYEGKFRLLVEPVTAEDKFAGLTQATGINAAAPQQSGLDYTTQIQVLQSPKLMAPIVEQLQTRYPDITYDSLLDKLAIARFQETKILEVRYRDTNPQKVQFVLEHLSQGYLKYSLQERQTNLRQGSEFVDEQMPQLRLRVNSLQRELQGFRQQYNFIDPEVKAQQLSTQVSTIEQQRLDTQKQIAEARASYTILQGSSGSASALNEAPIYQKMMGQLREVESEIAAQTVRFKEASPNIQGLREKRENLLPLLQREADRVLGNKVAEVANQISVLEVRAAAIARTEVSLNQQVKQLPALARQYTDLQRELKVATDSLNRFLEKRELLQIEIAQKEIPWQMIAASKLPTAPISPNVNRNLLIGVVAGLLAGIAAALLLEKLDNVFHSPEDLKQRTKLPLLGVIPFQKGIKQIRPVARVAVKMQSNGYKFVMPTADQSLAKNFPFLEAFRSLFTNISFLSSDAPINSLVISSSAPADGKSTVALNLAQAAAAMGQRVLLVDADLRLPRIHTLLGLPNEQGLSNVIAANFPVLDAIQRSLAWDNLFVLTSGQVPPDPTKLLSSKKMQNVMEQLRQEFDLVIYDTPPLLGLADSSLLATYTAGIVLVVRMSKTTRSALQQALEQLKVSRATVLGTVANGIRKYHAVSYNYYYRPRPQRVGLTAPMGGTPVPAVPSGMLDAEAQSGRPAWFERLQVEQDVRMIERDEPRQAEVIPFEAQTTPNAHLSTAPPLLPTMKSNRHQFQGREIKLAPVVLICLSLAVLGGLYSYLKQPAFFTQVSTAFSHAPTNGTQTNSFRLAVNQAMSAAILTQSAKSEAEWHLVESQWQEAIALMRAVPNSSPKYAIAQKKVTEYQHNLSYAQQRAANS